MAKYNIQAAIAVEKEGPFEFDLEHPETGKAKTFRIPKKLDLRQLAELEQDLPEGITEEDAAGHLNRIFFGDKQYDEIIEYGFPTGGDAETILSRDAMEYVIRHHIGEERAKKAMEQMMAEQKSQTNGNKAKPASRKKKAKPSA